jgi:capsule biosynthesis phosphatase
VEDSFTVGVPGQVYDAIYTGKIKMKPLRWVFDLDGTLVSAPTTHRDYSTCVPIEKTCNFVRYLYRNDHHIIIHTARHMRTCGGDVGEVVRRIGEITERYLREHDIPYHEIIYGKPYADIYVDDRAMNPCYWDRGNGWTTSSLGFGLDLSFRASSNSKIFKIDDHVCVKREDPSTLCGYVHHLKNVPAGLRDNVPRLLKFDHGSLVMQWIEGIPLGKMFCSGSLDLHVFDQVLELLSVIHDQKTDECREVRADVMRNYVPKLSERRAKYRELYELSSLDHEEVMEKLKSFFGNYRPVVKDCIHGDFWFGNLLWSHAEQKIYMIDMRGKVGDVVHLGGDMYYDYGKLYQSLSGFDWLINKGRLPDETYRDLFLRRFGEHVEKNDLDLNVIKTIAFGHMYGSLPFHKEIRENIRVYDELMTTLFLQI